MSFVIHNGFIITTPNIFSFIQRLDSKVREAQVDISAQQVASLIIKQIVVGENCSETIPGTQLFSQASSEWLQAYGDTPQSLIPGFFSFHFGQVESGRILAIAETSNHDAYQNILENNPDLTPYGYWDNADIPGTISAQEWEWRKQDWGELVAQGNGYTLEHLPSYISFIQHPFYRIQEELSKNREDTITLLNEHFRNGEQSILEQVIANRVFAENLPEYEISSVMMLTNYVFKAIHDHVQEHGEESLGSIEGEVSFTAICVDGDTPRIHVNEESCEMISSTLRNHSR